MKQQPWAVFIRENKVKKDTQMLEPNSHKDGMVMRAEDVKQFISVSTTWLDSSPWLSKLQSG